jgi:hypothetical protein
MVKNNKNKKKSIECIQKLKRPYIMFENITRIYSTIFIPGGKNRGIPFGNII